MVLAPSDTDLQGNLNFGCGSQLINETVSCNSCQVSRSDGARDDGGNTHCQCACCSPCTQELRTFLLPIHKFQDCRLFGMDSYAVQKMRCPTDRADTCKCLACDFLSSLYHSWLHDWSLLIDLALHCSC